MMERPYLVEVAMERVRRACEACAISAAYFEFLAYVERLEEKAETGGSEEDC